MPLFVLLLIPKVRRFEVIQFHRIPEGATVNGVLEQVKQRSNNPEFSDISFVGLYCPKTETELLLSPSSPTAASAKNRRPRPSLPNDLTTPRIDDALLSTENKSAAAAAAAITADPIPSTITDVNSTKKHGTEPEPCPPTTPQTQSTTPETPQSANSEPFPSPGSQAPSNILTSAGDFPPATITIDESMLSPPVDTSPILDLSGLGQLLVALPEHHRLKEIMKQCHKIMSSPAFGILTNGIDFLNQSGNSQIRQELQSIQDQKLAQTLSETLTQQHEQNHEINKAYEDQAKDLEARKAAAAAAVTVSTITPTSADARAGTYTSRPDQHGLSPLDQMRVQQNQQRAAEREIKRSILNPYQNNLEEATVTANGRMTPTDDSSNPGSFISPSQQKRLLIEAKKKAELDAIRQQGRTQSVSQSPFFASSPTGSSTSSIGPGVGKSYAFNKNPTRSQSLPLTEVHHRSTRTTLTASIDAPPLTESRPEVARVMSLPPQIPIPVRVVSTKPRRCTDAHPFLFVYTTGKYQPRNHEHQPIGAGRAQINGTCQFCQVTIGRSRARKHDQE